MSEMSRPITYLKGVGEKRAVLYKKLNILTVRDLLYHFPRGYTDFTCPKPLAEVSNGETAVVDAVIVKKLPAARIRRDFTVYKACAKDNLSQTDILLTFFNQGYTFDGIHENESYLFYGKVTGDLLKREMNSPLIVPKSSEHYILPNYPLTANLSVKMLRANMNSALNLIKYENIETLSDSIREKYELIDLKKALNDIHFPKSIADAKNASKRLAFDELLELQLGLKLLKTKNTEAKSGFDMKNVDISDFYAVLPFEMTNAQKTAVSEIIADMQKDIPMNRLLLGDVGSGKTVVAAACCYFAYKNGYQSALMAPTEILANQHYETLKSFLKPLEVEVCLLTGSMGQKAKNAVKKELLNGKFGVAVGTHALIQDSTQFCNLGLVITDEQHRFGVNQRAKLAQKGAYAHRLVMSATPIPRTLSQIFYADLDISLISERPKGRIPIETYGVTGKMRGRVFAFAEKELEKNKRVYIVCPMIEESENDLKSVCEYAETLRKMPIFKNRKIGLLHGKMHADEKNEVMLKFKNGDFDILVCTTVVEVGVDVPEATVMIIENAERFGLSQLHQLRGRVGRGSEKSYCILITDSKSEDALERVKILSKCADGFKISEEDLRMRGPGDFFGTRQHGLPELKIASLSGDMELVEMTKNAAAEILDEDSELKSAQNSLLSRRVFELFEMGADA